MILKQNWEKSSQNISIERATIEDMVRKGLPKQKLAAYEIISGGCANLNIKIECVNISKPFILRIYLREKDAALRELKLSLLLRKEIPIPEVYYVGDVENYKFSIIEYKEGITLRDLILYHPSENFNNIMVEVGSFLSKIQNYRFPISGFFDKNLHITKPLTQESYSEHARKCLLSSTSVHLFKNQIVSQIEFQLDKYFSLFPEHTDNFLVHGDYDPANIFVQNNQGKWKISGILDWEFAFSGSYLSDVANMLRYSHRMPREYKEFFLLGLQNSGLKLPDNWQIRVSLLNLVSLLDCVTRCSLDKHPKRCEDIYNLINFIIQNLENKR